MPGSTVAEPTDSPVTGPADVLPQAAARFGDKPALITDARVLSFVELDQLSDRVAAHLLGYGLLKGERVSLYAQNRWEWVVAYHAVLKAGGVINPISAMLTPVEVQHVASDCEAAIIIGSGKLIQELIDAEVALPSVRKMICFDAPAAGTDAFESLLVGASLPDESPARPEGGIDGNELCAISYTSGTTGKPKGVMQSRRSLLLNVTLMATMQVRTEHDVVLSALPAAHVYGNVVINSSLYAGATVVLMERFDPALALANIEKYRCTLFEGVPTMYVGLLNHPDIEDANLSSLTRSTVGGQSLPPATMKEWEERTGAPLIEGWGMTELSGTGVTHALYVPNVHGSIGMVLPSLEARVADLDDDSTAVPVGEAGELLVRGPLVMLGYHNDPEATREAISQDGWLRTGDLVTTNPEGYFFVVGRRKEVIVTAGYNVYPAEIERVIAEHPGVADVGVGSRSDPLKGELARAYVVVRDGAEISAPELLEYCRGSLAAYKLPRSIAFVDALPKSPTGKVLRRELQLLDGDGLPHDPRL